MASSYTTLLGLVLPATGDLNGTWGTTVNAQLTQLVEDSLAGYATASVLSTDWTLSTAGSGATNEARMMVLIPTGAPGVSRSIFAPKQSKVYCVINRSNAAVVIKGGPATPTTGVTIPAGQYGFAVWDANTGDFLIAGIGNTGTWAINTSGTAALATSLAGGSAGNVPYQSGANTTAMLAAGSAGQVFLSGGAGAPSWANQSSLSVGTATNLAGGVGGQIPYQSAAGTTALLANGTAGQVLTSAGGTLAPVWSPAAGLVSGTAQATTSGTAVDFTGIPSTAKYIMLLFSGVSTNGTSPITVRIGSGTFETTGYTGSASAYGGAGGTYNTLSTGFDVGAGGNALNVISGTMTLAYLGSSTWICGNTIGYENGASVGVTGGRKTITGTLDRVRITTGNGTDAFDAGSVNILYM